MNEYFLLLPILIPLVGGIVLWFCYNKVSETARNIITETVMVLNAAVTWMLVLARPEGELYLFSFTDTLPIVLRLDGLGCFFAAMTSTLAVFVTFYAFFYMKNEDHKHMFYTFFVITFAATGGVSMAGNLITLYFFYEMLTMSTIPLVMHGCKKKDIRAGYIYAAYQLGGAAFAFVGIVVLVSHLGSPDFTLGGVLELASAGDPVVNVIFLFILLGFGVKSCIFPFYHWLPIASVAPTPVTALLHSVAVVKAGVFAVMRTVYYVFGADLVSEFWSGKVGLALAIFTAVFAAVLAVKERHFKRRLAYSTVSNLSYILIGVLLCTEAGFAAALCHMLFHALIKMNAFLAAGSFMHSTGKAYVYELDGVGYKMPVTFVCYAVSALALTGIPLTSGFVSKWQLVTSSISIGNAWGFASAAALIISAFLCAVYSITPAVRAFLPVKGETKANGRDVVGMCIPMVIFALANVVFGVSAGGIVDICHAIASGIM